MLEQKDNIEMDLHWKYEVFIEVVTATKEWDKELVRGINIIRSQDFHTMNIK